MNERHVINNQDEGFGRHSDDPPKKTSADDLLSRLADILSQRRLQDSLPLPELETFSGDLFRYPAWLKSFETIIERHTQKVPQRFTTRETIQPPKPKRH